jgi:hypothetical protein
VVAIAAVQAIRHPDTRAIQAVLVYRDRLDYTIFDDSIRGDVETLQQLNAGELHISDRDHWAPTVP